MPGYLSGFVNIKIHPFRFGRVDLDFHAAQQIDRFGYSLKIHNHIILNIQIQITVQHPDRFLCAAFIICVIRFSEIIRAVVADI